MPNSMITYRPKTAEFIQAVKDYRIQTGEGLRVSFDHVSLQIENGILKISKYCDGLNEDQRPDFTAGELQALYLSWVNDYLSLPKFAEDNGLTLDQADRVIEVGREINESVAAFKRAMRALS